MGCFASKPEVHESPPPPSVLMTQRAQSSTTVPTPPPTASVPSTPTLSRPRSRTSSLRQPTHTEGSSSTSRTRARSMPQNLERSSSQDRRRAQTLTPGERHTRMCDSWLGYEPSITASQGHPKAGGQSLASTMRQVLSNHRKYVARFWNINYVYLMPP